MTVAIAPVQAATQTVDPALQQLLMRLTGALNRRRAYAPTHPMVVAAEQQLHESVVSLLVSRPVLTIGVMKADLLIDGEPFVTRSSYARELATRLHRRGVGAITLQVGVPLAQLREMLNWLAVEPASDEEFANDKAPVLSMISITRVAYDQLTLADAERAVKASGEQLWRSLAQIAGKASADGQVPEDDGEGGNRHTGATESDRAAVMSALRATVDQPDVARRTAIAFLDLSTQGVAALPEWRVRIGEQLYEALETLGGSNFGPIIRALGERAVQQRFVSQVVDVLPVAAVANWLQIAAQAQEQQMSHYMLRLMGKLSTFAEDQHNTSAESVFRGAAQDLVKGWALDDPNPEEHVALLDRIALHERIRPGVGSRNVAHSSVIESSRLVQMAIELDVLGADGEAAAQALVDSGAGPELMHWADSAGGSRTARRLFKIATNDCAIRKLLLTEPVDRLQARALLERLDESSAETLIDVLEGAEARGTRMIVRQRLAEFGAAIAPNLLARLDTAPWYLVRNILTLLHEIAASSGDAARTESMAKLLDHAQVQVRAEAFRLLLLDPHAHDAAIRHALHDGNERMVVLALQALGDAPEGQRELPQSLVTELMTMVDAGTQNETVRARMIRTLAQTRSETVRNWLMGHVVKRSRILRRISLQEPTQTAVAAMQVLQRVYGDDAEVKPLLELARNHGYDRRWLSRDSGSSTEQST